QSSDAADGLFGGITAGKDRLGGAASYGAQETAAGTKDLMSPGAYRGVLADSAGINELRASALHRGAEYVTAGAADEAGVKEAAAHGGIGDRPVREDEL